MRVSDVTGLGMISGYIPVTVGTFWEEQKNVRLEF